MCCRAVIRVALCSAIVLLAACSPGPVADEKPATVPVAKSASKLGTEPVGVVTALQEVAIHVPDMTKRLELVWLAWPNRVEKALSGLSGVKAIEVDLDKDVLHVRFDAGKVTIKKLLAEIDKEGFQGKIVPKE